jgi:uncharacterized protein (TIGR02996 family)
MTRAESMKSADTADAPRFAESSDSAIRRAILETPEDDAPRLVFADWLDEHDQSGWAGFIRTCIRCGHENGCTLQPHVHADRCWWVTHGFRFNAAVPGLNLEWYLYRRGLVDELRMPTAAFLAHAAELFRVHPITAVRLTDREPEERQPGGWGYYVPERSDVLQRPHWLPRVFRRSGGSPEGVDGVLHPSADEAAAALSLACVAYGRSLCGLPPRPAPVGSAT